MDLSKIFFICLFFLAQQTFASNSDMYYNYERLPDTLNGIFGIVDVTKEEKVYVIQAQNESKLYTIIVMQEDVASKNLIIQLGKKYFFKTTKYFEKDCIPRTELSCMISIADCELSIPMCGFNILIAYDLSEVSAN